MCKDEIWGIDDDWWVFVEEFDGESGEDDGFLLIWELCLCCDVEWCGRCLKCDVIDVYFFLVEYFFINCVEY